MCTIALELPTEVPDRVEDVRGMITCFNAQFGSSQVSHTHQPLRPELPGVAGLEEDLEQNRLFPLLFARGCQAPRALKVRLIAHEIEHARHLSDSFLSGLEYAPGITLLEIIEELTDFVELQQRVQRRVRAIIASNPEFLVKSDNPAHYTRPDEILARLRAYSVFLQQAAAATNSVEPHELFEVFDAADLRWLNQNYIEMRGRDLSPAFLENSQLSRRKPR